MRKMLSKAVALGALGLALALGQPAAAQDYPTGPVKIVVPFGPGGSTDTLARLLATGLEEALGQPVVVENRAGGAGIVGGREVANAEPDGQTLLMASSTVHNSPLLFNEPPYNSAEDLAPIIVVGSFPFVLVGRNDLPADNAADLLAYAKAHPAELTFGTLGGFSDVLAGALESAAGADLQLLHYQGVSEIMTSIVSGEADLAWAGYYGIRELVDTGKMQLLGVASLEPNAQMEGVPTLATSGADGLEITNVVGLLAPAGTPEAIINTLNGHVIDIIATDEMQEAILSRGFEIPADQSPQYYADTIKRKMEVSAKVIEELGFEKQ